MSRLHVCVDRNVAPFGHVIVMGLLLTWILATGAPSVMKWLVAPESLMAFFTCVLVGRGHVLCA